MLEFGAQEKWPPKFCERKWEELHPELVFSNAATPAPQQPLPIRQASTFSVTQNWIAQDSHEFGSFAASPVPTYVTRSPRHFSTPVISRSPLPKSPGDDC